MNITIKSYPSANICPKTNQFIVQFEAELPDGQQVNVQIPTGNQLARHATTILDEVRKHYKE